MKMGKGYFFGGLGLGMVICSFFAFMVINQNENMNPPLSVLSKEEIIQQAGELGMIFITELPSATKDWTEEEVIVRARELGMDFVADEIETNEAEVSEMEPDPVQEIVSIYIPPGSSAIAIGKILVQGGIIADSEAFSSFIMKEQATTKLRAGTFEIPAGSTNEEILFILQRKEQ